MHEAATRILRVAPLASASGRYGGPFDTAVAQASLMSAQTRLDALLLSPHLAGDEPKERGTLSERRFVSPGVKPLIPRSGFTLLFSWSALRTLQSLVRSADVVHVSFSRELFPVLAAMASLRGKKKLIVQPHGMLTARTSLAHRALDLLVRPIFNRASSVIALTAVERADLENWAGASSPPIVVIGNPISISANLDELRSTSRAREALFLARLHPRKRVGDFIEAANVARKEGWSDRYAVVGPDQGDLDAVVSAERGNDSLNYEGVLPGAAVPSRLAASRIFVLPSQNEPWGNVLVTALAIGVPVVVTESAALAATIDSASLGIVVADGDPRAIAEAVHRLMTLSDEDYDALSERCRSFAARKLSNSAVGASLAAHYTEVHSTTDAHVKTRSA